MNSSDLKDPGDIFTTNGEDVWELMSFALQPSCLMKNLKTGAEEGFAMGGLTAQKFHKIKMPVVDS